MTDKKILKKCRDRFDIDIQKEVKFVHLTTSDGIRGEKLMFLTMLR